MFFPIILSIMVHATISDDGIPLQVASLNTWGLILAPFRSSRMQAIANKFVGSDFDVLLVQELWVESDYTKMASAMHDRFPFSQYFPAGIVGSGQACFSRWPIVDIDYRRYSLAGRPERIFHGDWYSGRGASMCRVKHPELGYINLYNTHLVASYARHGSKDIYSMHRLSELYELVAFVDETSGEEGISILAGDFNTEPEDRPYRMLLRERALYTPQRHSLLRSVWDDNSGVPVEQRMTSGLPGNVFPSGGLKQLDHILYLNNGRLRSASAEVILTGSIPKHDYNYSDHAAISTTFVCYRGMKQRVAEEGEDGRADVNGLLGELSDTIDGRGESASMFKALMTCCLFAILACVAVIFVSYFQFKKHWALLVAAMLLPIFTYFFMLCLYVGFYAIPEEVSGLRQFSDQWRMWTQEHMEKVNWTGN